MTTDYLLDSRPHLEKALHDLKDRKDQILRDAAADIDKKIEALEQILGGSVRSETSLGSSVEEKAEETKPAARQVRSSVVTKSAASAASRTKAEGRIFNSEVLTKEFKGLDVKDAIAKALVQAPDKTFDTVELIKVIYGKFDDAELMRAKNSLSLFLGRGAKQGLWRKVASNPIRCQANLEQPPSE